MYLLYKKNIMRLFKILIVTVIISTFCVEILLAICWEKLLLSIVFILVIVLYMIKKNI